ncbi:MAG: DUF1344 domain-containing protein [Phyllobacteriaceae bacterium]|nr:DUF1344 domain-containing protein [Phyllobacteriaceae bacterium]
MKKILATVIASAAMLAAAIAAEMEGVVKAVDAAARKVVLEDSSELAVADGVVLDGIEAGAKVKITVDDASKAITAIAKL